MKAVTAYELNTRKKNAHEKRTVADLLKIFFEEEWKDKGYNLMFII